VAQVSLLARIIQEEWIMPAILVTYLHEPLQTQEHPTFGFQIPSWVESEYVEACRGLGGLSPQTYRLWGVIRAKTRLAVQAKLPAWRWL